MSLELAYFYGSEAEQYSFYRIPKVLLTASAALEEKSGVLAVNRPGAHGETKSP